MLLAGASGTAHPLAHRLTALAPFRLVHESFLARRKEVGFTDAAFMDAPAVTNGSTKARAWEAVREEVGRLKRLVFPRHGM